MKLTCPSLTLCGLTIQLFTGTAVFGEEGGSGHYLPGSIASFVDGTPTTPAFGARYNFIYYAGSIGVPIPVAGLSPANVNAQSYANGFTLFWRPKIEIADGLSYAMSTTIPYLWLDVSGQLSSKSVSSSVNGLGDMVLMPLMLNYAVTKDFHLDFRTGSYAPTGSYEVGRLANTGKNFWTCEPTLGLLYLGQKNGIEASIYAGIDFNTENNATHYRSGDQFHLDGTLAQHFKLADGLVGVGASGFWYDQVTGDSGSGATFGSFEARTAGVGPVISYVHKIGKVDMITELKWLHEVDTQNRLQGDYIWLKVAFRF
jgi:hypothetical protein